MFFNRHRLIARRAAIAVAAAVALAAPALRAASPDDEGGAAENAGRWGLSTNVVGLGMGIANASGHFAFARQWTAELTVGYSAWDYFSADRKFRTFTVRPEVRWWARPVSSGGLFVDAHLAMTAYNFVLPGWEYRIQDRDGKHPALGGGLGLGYRLNLGSGAWALEAQAGVGVYHLDYCRYVNRPNGPLADTRRRTWVGLDNAALSIVYTFNANSRR